ncbi:histidine kinase dimerization/phospho-acceptor domain-containing protein [Cobetia marina]|jgi:two-component system sensor histidine kinase BaeS|uniref:ATP-binding protein n=1 Tax=Cobetia marina TaxID=28258 RepID=UPI0026E1B46E|nr:ATP-binding protein [Cobetia marina]MDO6788842.1 histidine kinase dimerization/phospho-acceptor domain-containing protein [Cobetia marina]
MIQPVTALRSRLSVRLFVILLLTNVVIGGSIYLFISKSMDKGFAEYLQQTQQERVEMISTDLISAYAAEGSWQWLKSRRNWGRIVHSRPPSEEDGMMPGPGMSPPPGREDSMMPGPGMSRPPVGEQAMLLGPNMTRPQDYMLRDADGQRLNGAPRPIPGMQFKDLMLDGSKIGELGYLPVSEMLKRGKDQYLERQSRDLAIIMLSSAFASLLAAAGIAWWLGHRVRDLASGANRLSSGDYATRLPVRGQDELSRLAEDFNALAATLESNRDSRQRWVSDISHELRTPLAVLKGEIEAMQDGFRPMSHSSLGSLAQEVDALNRLVADLRLLAQSDAGTLEAWREPLALDTQLRDSLDDLRGWLADAGIELETDIPLPLRVLGDTQRLHQLWSNLASNTRAYTDAPGRLKVSLLHEAASPAQGAGHPGWAIVRWEDSSPGVPDAELAHLTERLYRVENSRNRSSGGSGLGLAIASALVSAHEGELVPGHSTLGGLRWDIRLPLLST